MKKWIIPIALILVCALTLSVSAIEPRATRITPSLTFSGTTANCTVIVSAVGSEIDVTMELWTGSTLVDSWNNDGTTRVVVEGSCTVTKGKTYTLKTYGTIDGVKFTGTSVSGTC